MADRVEPRDGALARPRRRGFIELARALWGRVGPDRGVLIACLVSLTVATGLGLVLPYATKIAIDDILTDNPGPAGWPEWVPFDRDSSGGRGLALLSLGGVMLAAGLTATGVGLWGRWHCTRIVKRLQARLRRVAFEHAIRLPLSRVSELKSGGVASILREDAGQAGDLVFSMIYNPWRAVIQLVGTLVILATIDWRLLLGALGIIPIVWLTHRTWIARLRPVFRDIRRTRESIDAQAAESFGGIRVVRGFNRGAAEAARFGRDSHFMVRQEIMAWWWSRLLEMAWEILVPVSSVAVLMYGGWRVINGGISVGELMAFSAYIFMLLGPIESLVSTASGIQTNLAGFDRTLELLDEPVEFADSPAVEGGGGGGGGGGPLVLTRGSTRGRVTLDGVGFAYSKPRGARHDGVSEAEGPEMAGAGAGAGGGGGGRLAPVLHGITLDVAPGETIALVGPSGSGKSTLCNLIARFYDPTRGSVRLDGVDLRRIEIDSYRRLLGIVEQDVFLFDGTVAENIAYARRHATSRDIREAAEIANASRFIEELEHGYGTLIGERGVRLSGGQKQRLAIARAVLADPRILILDEATSSLDAESERLIQLSLGRLMKGRTSFVIAHRLSTIRHADRIVVLDRGRVIEIGPHEELIAAGGRYAELLRLQLEGAPA